MTPDQYETVTHANTCATHGDRPLSAQEHPERDRGSEERPAHEIEDDGFVTVYPHLGVTPNPKWSVNRLKREHDAVALRIAMAKHSPTAWAEPFEFETDGFKFQRLVSDQELAQEGMAQRHCVASYTRRAKSMEVIIFRVTGKERATFAFEINRFELKGFANSKVSDECATAARKAQRAYNAHLIEQIKDKPMGAA